MRHGLIGSAGRLLAFGVAVFLGAGACGDDDDTGGGNNSSGDGEVTVKGVVADPEVYVFSHALMGLSVEEALMAAAREGIPIATDIRQDVRVLSDVSGAFSLKVPANSSFRLVTFYDDGKAYMPTSDNVEYEVGTQDVNDAIIFACSATRSGAVRMGDVLDIELDEVLQRGYCTFSTMSGSFPQMTPIDNTTATVNTPGFNLYAGVLTMQGVQWVRSTETTTTSRISVFAVTSDDTVSSPTDVSVTFSDSVNQPPFAYPPFTCRVLPGFSVFARPHYPDR